MRSITNLLLIATVLVVSSFSKAAHVQCFSAGRTIYSGYAKSVFYDEHTLIVHRGGKKNDLFIVADCLVEI